MAKRKKKRAGKKKRKSTKRSRAAKRAYKKSGLYKYNLKRKRHGGSKRKKRYSKKKSKARRRRRHKSYAAHQLARVDWGAIGRAAQKSKQRRAAAEAGFGGPPKAKYANTAYLARLRKKHKRHGGASSGGLPAWF